MSYYVQDAGLGFSLKPPKWLRKAQPLKAISKMKLKDALKVGAIVGGAIIAGPTVFAAAKGAAKFAGGKMLPALFSAGRGLKAGALLKGARAAAGAVGTVTGAATAAAPILTAFTPSAVDVMPAQSYAPEIPAASSVAMMPAGGGGGASVTATDDAAYEPDKTALLTAVEAAPTAMAVAGGLAVLALAYWVSKSGRRRR